MHSPIFPHNILMCEKHFVRLTSHQMKRDAISMSLEKKKANGYSDL